jgi:hypothetical protein
MSRRNFVRCLIRYRPHHVSPRCNRAEVVACIRFLLMIEQKFLSMPILESSKTRCQTFPHIANTCEKKSAHGESDRTTRTTWTPPHSISPTVKPTRESNARHACDSGARSQTYHLSMPTPVGSVLAPRSSLHM